MYDNATVKARYIRPYSKVISRESGKIITVPGKKAIMSVTHVMARDGRFIFSYERFLFDVSSQEKETSKM